MSANPTQRGLSGYTLVVCEKPDAARRVAEALSSGAPEAFKAGGVQAFRLADARGRRYVVCAAAGHLYGMSDTVKDRRVYPALDLEWFPLEPGREKWTRSASSRIRAIRGLSEGATAFVNACDLDIEGETIGFNILRYAAGGKEVSALRARFSALTKEEIVGAFEDENLRPADGLARAGRLRHAIDFLWGVNLSRALSESMRKGRGYMTLSIGRVQGPTLSFVVEKEMDVGTFVPTPYWEIEGEFRKGEVGFKARYSKRAVPARREAEEVKAACEGREGVVSGVTRRAFTQRPPPPFNLADLQKEAYHAFGYTPSKTLQVAERLYLRAMISYPRTGSQRLPRLDFARLLSRIAAIPGYGSLVEIVAHRAGRPVEGPGVDPAHPAIYPTGQLGGRPLSPEERGLFDLIVRRFLSCFGEDAVREASTVEVSVGEHRFENEQVRLLVPGWTRLVRGDRGTGASSAIAAALGEGDRVDVRGVVVEEHVRARPVRYNQATLLEKMEGEGIGTKATRADTISTLLSRGYVAGERLAPTELGFALVEAMREHCPQIVSTRLTREIEAQLERVAQSGEPGWEGFEGTLSTLLAQLSEVRSHESEIAGRMGSSVSEAATGRMILGSCPVCKEGKLWVVRSHASGKRFVGCSNYPKGCRASAPLPQRGTIRAASKPCSACGWPVVHVKMGRRPWRLCVNDRCPRKVNVYAMQDLQRKGARGRRPALEKS